MEIFGILTIVFIGIVILGAFLPKKYDNSEYDAFCDL